MEWILFLFDTEKIKMLGFIRSYQSQTLNFRKKIIFLYQGKETNDCNGDLWSI